MDRGENSSEQVGRASPHHTYGAAIHSQGTPKLPPGLQNPGAPAVVNNYNGPGHLRNSGGGDNSRMRMLMSWKTI